MKEAILGVRTFDDGTVRTVFLDKDGRQYVLDENERRAYGRWLDPEKAEPDKCVVVPSPDASTSPTPVKDCTLHEECCREVTVFRWTESDKAGVDVGQEYAIRRWVREHWPGFVRSMVFEHLLGNRCYTTFRSITRCLKKHNTR